MNEEQIIAMLREQGASANLADVCRKRAIGSARFSNGRRGTRGLEIPGARRQKALDDEDPMLKKLLAQAMPGNATR